MSPGDQDEIARIIIQLAGSDVAAVSLSVEEREALARSKAAAGGGRARQ
jgi:hypothetical protein